MIYVWEIKLHPNQITLHSSKLALGEIHFWVRFHELFHLSFLLKLIWGRKTLLFLPHIKHHFLYSWSCLSIKVRKFRRLRINFLSIDFSITLNWSAPPWSLIFPFLNIDMNVFSFISFKLSIFNGPISLFRVNFVFPFSVDQWLSFNIYFKLIDRNIYFGIFLCYIGINENKHFEILKN